MGEKKSYKSNSENIVSKGCPRAPSALAAAAPLGDPKMGSPELCRALRGCGGLGAGQGHAWVGVPGQGGGLGAQGRAEAAGRPCCPVQRRRGAAGS